MTDQIVTCHTCKKSGDPRVANEWHPFRHPINVNGTIPSTETFGKTPPDRLGGSGHPIPPRDAHVNVQTMPFDPVLRQALVDKGILTPDDLREAEAKIRVVTGQFQETMTNERTGAKRR
jgi:hypothetical protein